MKSRRRAHLRQTGLGFWSSHPHQNHNSPASGGFLTTLMLESASENEQTRRWEDRILHFLLEKQKSETRSPYVSLFSPPPATSPYEGGRDAGEACPPSLTLAAGRWQRWGGWPPAASGSHPSAPCWGRWSSEQIPGRPWWAGPPPRSAAGPTPWGAQEEIKGRNNVRLFYLF